MYTTHTTANTKSHKPRKYQGGDQKVVGGPYLPQSNSSWSVPNPIFMYFFLFFFICFFLFYFSLSYTSDTVSNDIIDNILLLSAMWNLYQFWIPACAIEQCCDWVWYVQIIDRWQFVSAIWCYWRWQYWHIMPPIWKWKHGWGGG